MIDYTREREVLQDEVGEGFSLAYVSCAALCDMLEQSGFMVGSRPDINKKVFAWFEQSEDLSTCPLMSPAARILRMCGADRCAPLLDKTPRAYALLVTPDDVFPAELMRLRNRIIHVPNVPDPRVVASAVQFLFMQSVVWENQLRRLAATGTSLRPLLDLMSEILRGYVCVISDDCSLMGECSGFRRPVKSFRFMFAEPYYSSEDKNDSELISLDLDEDSEAHEAQPIESGAKYFLRCPLSIHSAYVGSVLLETAGTDVPHGLKLMFQHLTAYVLEFLGRQHGDNFDKTFMQHYCLTALLRGDVLDKATLASFKETLSIPTEAQFKIVALDAKDCPNDSKELLISCMSRLNNGSNHCLFHNGRIVCICFAPLEAGTVLANVQTFVDLRNNVYVPLGAICGFSQVFTDIYDVHHAYQEAIYVLQHRDLIMKEMLVANDVETECIGLPFEAALPYIAINGLQVDERLLDFALSGAIGVPGTLAKEEASDPTGDFALLWYFLKYERNASRVGRIMFMHRNSVLYRIKQIEKRFALSLDDQLTRERIIMEYRLVFQRLDRERLEALFKVKQAESTD
ncbi:MAG: helix-turn-helix domain-containing protein [Coriobacteriales bacterium]|nr:helix-turn-helix domain-containing protein [Coriobacteriales bacterium]